MKLFSFRKFSFFLGLGWVRGLCKKLFSFSRKSFFQEVKVNLFISCLDLKSLLGRLNQQSSPDYEKFFYSTLNQQSS